MFVQHGLLLGAIKRVLERDLFLFYNRYVDPWARAVFGNKLALAPNEAGSNPAGSTTKNFVFHEVFCFKIFEKIELME